MTETLSELCDRSPRAARFFRDHRRLFELKTQGEIVSALSILADADTPEATRDADEDALYAQWRQYSGIPEDDVSRVESTEPTPPPLSAAEASAEWADDLEAAYRTFAGDLPAHARDYVGPPEFLGHVPVDREKSHEAASPVKKLESERAIVVARLAAARRAAAAATTSAHRAALEAEIGPLEVVLRQVDAELEVARRAA